VLNGKYSALIYSQGKNTDCKDIVSGSKSNSVIYLLKNVKPVPSKKHGGSPTPMAANWVRLVKLNSIGLIIQKGSREAAYFICPDGLV
jgi:hypothetical protein